MGAQAEKSQNQDNGINDPQFNAAANNDDLWLAQEVPDEPPSDDSQHHFLSIVDQHLQAEAARLQAAKDLEPLRRENQTKAIQKSRDTIIATIKSTDRYIKLWEPFEKDNLQLIRAYFSQYWETWGIQKQPRLFSRNKPKNEEAEFPDIGLRLPPSAEDYISTFSENGLRSYMWQKDPSVPLETDGIINVDAVDIEKRIKDQFTEYYLTHTLYEQTGCISLRTQRNDHPSSRVEIRVKYEAKHHQIIIEIKERSKFTRSLRGDVKTFTSFDELMKYMYETLAARGLTKAKRVVGYTEEAPEKPKNQES